MLRLRASHRTDIAYAGTVHDSVNEVRVIPHDDGRQAVEDPYVHVEPAADVFLHTDAFGNRVAWFQVATPHRLLRIEATATVTVDPREAAPGAVAWDAFDDPGLRDEVGEYLLESPRVTPSPAVEAFAAEVDRTGTGDAVEWLRHAERAVCDSIEYQPGSTTVDSTVDHLLEVRRGVCQDMAHLFLALCRRRGVPARYVSGWLYEPERTTPNESHAWCEAWLPGHGWLEFDPTHPEPRLDHYIRVGVGRDYSDVPPVRGHYVGADTQGMTVTVEITPAPEPAPAR